MLKSFVVACVLAAGCKADRPATSEGAASGSDPAGATQDPGGRSRSGKIDLGLRRGGGAGSEAADSSITGQELMAERRRARLSEIDTDGDGEISEEERRASRQRRAESMHARLDTNGDGKLTPDELAASRFRRFDPESLDLDKNGEISIDELAKALEQRSQAWGVDRFRRRLDGGSGQAP
jgi:hypothetical protein